ncbi:hypothetical protein ACH4SP_03060 [Streptomyces sp. NPDC021093]|uniref:hypothetical protein n=1 Tax=Streptomyces sp. NPDC021093 TaxID=3365112 RepID=UPI003791F760
MPDPATDLAMTGASVIVAAMATAAWQSTRTAAVRLFRRGGQERESQLDTNAALVVRAEDARLARGSLRPLWQLELENLLDQHPEIAGELTELITRVQHQLPAADTYRQEIDHHGTGSVFAVQGPHSGIHQHPLPRPAPARPAPPTSTPPATTSPTSTSPAATPPTSTSPAAEPESHSGGPP